MLVTLADREGEVSQYISRAVLVAPCTVIDPPSDEPDLTEKSMSEVGQLQKLGIYYLPTDDWTADLQKLKTEIPSLMEYAQYLQPSMAKNSAKNYDHMLQEKKTLLFQTYVSDWRYPDKYLGRAYPLENIEEVQITLFVAEKDNVCPPDKAEYLASKLKTLQGYYRLSEWDHNQFFLNQEEVWAKLLESELTTEPKSENTEVEIPVYDPAYQAYLERQAEALKVTEIPPP